MKKEINIIHADDHFLMRNSIKSILADHAHEIQVVTTKTASNG
ncbi:MAG: hypothetical protein ABI675_01055 [Chitinophagaceae bacterium]